MSVLNSNLFNFPDSAINKVENYLTILSLLQIPISDIKSNKSNIYYWSTMFL